MKRMIASLMVWAIILSSGSAANAAGFGRSSDISGAAVLLDCYDYSGNLFLKGSGFAAIEEGIILTNAYMTDGAASLKATVIDGTVFDITRDGFLASDWEADVAILRADTPDGMPFLSAGSAYSMKDGEAVSVLNISGEPGNSSIRGVFKGIKTEEGADYLTFEAEAPCGSGNALLNSDREVIGITTCALAAEDGLFFAIPINRAVELLEKLQRGEYETGEPEETAEADRLLAIGEYARAEQIFAKAGLTEQVHACRYQQAHACLLEKNYEEAIRIYTELAKEGYRDSKNRLLDAEYFRIMQLMETGDAGLAADDSGLSVYSYAADLREAGYPEAEKIYGYAVSALHKNGVAAFSAGDYESAEEIFSLLSDGLHQDSDVYLALCSVYRNAELNDSQFELLLERTDLPAVKKALAANNTIAFRFLEGEWREPHGQHFDFSDGHIIRDDFPRVVWEGGYVDIEDGVIRRYTDAHTTPREDKAFQVISRDQIALFCYVDGRTYTLNRKA